MDTGSGLRTSPLLTVSWGLNCLMAFTGTIRPAARGASSASNIHVARFRVRGPTISARDGALPRRRPVTIRDASLVVIGSELLSSAAAVSSRRPYLSSEVAQAA
jgi:hypothetical protein